MEKTLLLSDLSLENLNYLIMLISHGDDVGASLESIVSEINRRATNWREGQPDPDQIKLDTFADSEIAKGYANPDCLDSNEDFPGDDL